MTEKQAKAARLLAANKYFFVLPGFQFVIMCRGEVIDRIRVNDGSMPAFMPVDGQQVECLLDLDDKITVCGLIELVRAKYANSKAHVRPSNTNVFYQVDLMVDYQSEVWPRERTAVLTIGIGQTEVEAIRDALSDGNGRGVVISDSQ